MARRKRDGGTKLEAPDYAGFISRTMRAMARRAVADGDLDQLSELVKLRATLDDAIDHAAVGLHVRPGSGERGTGYSWTQLGAAVGVTRQAAHQRWGAAAAALADELAAAEQATGQPVDGITTAAMAMRITRG